MPLTLVPPRQGRSRYWRLRGSVRGIAVDETTGVEGRELAEAIRIKREAQLLDESVFGARASRTFPEATVAYIEAVQPRGMQRDTIIGRKRADGSLSPCLLTDFGNRLVNSIDQMAASEVIRRRFAGRKPGTIERNFITPLVAVLRFAARQKWCDPPMLERPKYDDRRRRWANYEEADRLLEHAALHARSLFQFLMLTGARVGEAVELDWTDVDLSQRWLVFRGTKNGEDRGVPIHPQLVATLANLPGDRTGPVFLTQRGRPYVDRHRREGGQCKTAWRLACARAKITDLRPHDLRHSFSTWLTMAGVHEQVRDEIMGHASTSMGRRYSHIPRDDLIAAVDKLPSRGIGVDLRPRKVAKYKSAKAVA